MSQNKRVLTIFVGCFEVMVIGRDLKFSTRLKEKKRVQHEIFKVEYVMILSLYGVKNEIVKIVGVAHLQ